MIDRIGEIENVAGLKWSFGQNGWLTFERAVEEYSERFCVIDNQLSYVSSHILGARGFENHVGNYWPQWADSLWGLLQHERYPEAQREMMRVLAPFMTLWKEMENETSGDGYLDKLCLEIVGLGSSRCRPPTRDLREKFRGRARQMLIDTGVPGVQGTIS